MRLLRAEVVGVGPFESLAFPFVDEEDKPRLLTVVHGGGGVGKTSLLQALSSTRPGHCVTQLRQRETRLDEEPAELPPAKVVCHWWLGQDDSSRPHPLVLASPSARVFADEQEETLRRREQVVFDRAAGEGGFAFLAIASTRWFSRQPIALSAPARGVARYDVKATSGLDDASRSDLSRDTKQALAYAAIVRALASGEKRRKSFERLGDAMRDVVGSLTALTGFQYLGLDAFSFEPTFRDAGGRTMGFDALPTRARHLVAFGALSVRMLWAAYPERDPRAAEGVVAIDEVDLHQDSAVQAELCGVLREVLPDVQWILTTTSPLIAAACDPSEVLALRRLPEHRDVVLYAGDQALTH
ncbi:MAG TPA: hypothetical protein VM686_21230 [Polyangiaceae bacterium]|nr:hypothetical protein [Polyangiaceae bacterium]